jgi:hypothetical protein
VALLIKHIIIFIDYSFEGQKGEISGVGGNKIKKHYQKAKKKTNKTSTTKKQPGGANWGHIKTKIKFLKKKRFSPPKKQKTINTNTTIHLPRSLPPTSPPPGGA